MKTYLEIKKLLKGVGFLVVTYIEGEPEITIEYRKRGFTARDQYDMAKAVEEHLRANGIEASRNRHQNVVLVEVTN